MRSSSAGSGSTTDPPLHEPPRRQGRRVDCQVAGARGRTSGPGRHPLARGQRRVSGHPGGNRGATCMARRLSWALLLLLTGSGWGQTPRRPAPEWTCLGLGGGGAMYAPAISPADPKLTLLSCDMSGVYRSVDGGRSWELIHYRQLSNATGVRPAWHPTDPDIAFAAGGGDRPLKV